MGFLTCAPQTSSTRPTSHHPCFMILREDRSLHMASPCNITSSIPSCCGSLVVHPSVAERPTGCTRHLTMSMTMLPMLPDACWDRALEYRGWKRNGNETIGRGLALDRVGTVPDPES